MIAGRKKADEERDEMSEKRKLWISLAVGGGPIPLRATDPVRGNTDEEDGDEPCAASFL